MIGIVVDLLRNICSLVDYGIYSIVAGLYDTIMIIAKINVFSGGVNGDNLVSKISGNIYAFLGIFMLFRLAIGFIQYIMDPDKLTDSKLGGQKLLLRVLTVIILIVGTPLIFKEAIKLQDVLLSENVVGKMIMGSGDISKSTNGESFSFMIYKNVALSPTPNFSSIKALRGASVYTSGGYPNYTYEYRWLLSFFVGGFLAYVLLITCIDVALRSVKLAFYEMISPIPIVSYLIPGQEGMIKKWSGDAIKTYLSIFITLAAFQFGILLIIYLGTNIKTIINLGNGNIFVFIFLILGVLLFIKELPNILKGMGLNVSSGGYGLSLGKRLAPGAMIPGALAGGIAGAISSAKARRDAGGGVGRSIASGLAGFGAGAFTGFKSGMSSKDGKGVITNAMKSTNARATNIKNGTNAANRWVDKAKANLGFDKDNSQRSAQIAAKQNAALRQSGKKIFDEAAAKSQKPKDYLYEQWKTRGDRGIEYADISQRIDGFKKNIGTEKNILMEMEKSYKSGQEFNGEVITAEIISDQSRKISDYEDSMKTLTDIKDNYAKDGLHDEFVGQEKAMKYYDKIDFAEKHNNN